MKEARRSFAISTLLLLVGASEVQGATEQEQVLASDARFWAAYNACDMAAIDALVTDDIEFYHDQTGLTASRSAVVSSLRNGPCGNPKMKLRRELVAGSLKFHALAGGYALLSGQQRFNASEDGGPERVSAQAEFTHVWKLVDGTWRMHRVLSYAHGPAPYQPPPTSLHLPVSVLENYAGHYQSERVGEIVVAVDAAQLKLTAGNFVATLRPETPTRFFALEQDLRFEFEKSPKGSLGTLAIYENGVLTERARRVR
jgi:ketosteroid isomerase-like protein